MFDIEVTLLTQNGTTKNKIGDKVPTFEEVTILGADKPVNRYEFYTAGRNGIDLSRMIVIHPFEYAGQKLLKINDVTYSVVRAFQLSNEEIELSLKVKTGNQ